MRVKIDNGSISIIEAIISLMAFVVIIIALFIMF